MSNANLACAYDAATFKSSWLATNHHPEWIGSFESKTTVQHPIDLNIYLAFFLGTQCVADSHFSVAKGHCVVFWLFVFNFGLSV